MANIYLISSNHKYSLKLINISSCASGVSTRTVVFRCLRKDLFAIRGDSL